VIVMSQMDSSGSGSQGGDSLSVSSGTQNQQQASNSMRQWCLSQYTLYPFSSTVNKRRCLYCEKTFFESSSASSLAYHLEQDHPAKFALAPTQKQRMTGFQPSQQPTLAMFVLLRSSAIIQRSCDKFHSSPRATTIFMRLPHF